MQQLFRKTTSRSRSRISLRTPSTMMRNSLVNRSAHMTHRQTALPVRALRTTPTLVGRTPARVANSVGSSVPNPSRAGFSRRAIHAWKGVEMGPPDPILGVTVAFNNDKDPRKINLGVGAYRDDKGKPYVLGCVREAEKRIFEANMNHEYAGISGVPEFPPLAAKLILGENSPAIAQKRTVSAQSISGTGALRVASEFFSKWYPFEGKPKTVYFPSPTWGNHNPIFKNAGFDVKTYSYYDPSTCGLNFKGLINDVANAPKGSLFLFHACAHNPTGVDPTPEQWQEIEQVVRDRDHFPFFDAAYQGFASGNPEADGYAPRYFVEKGHNIALAQSFAKNFGLYGERVGGVHFVCADPAEAERVDSQLKITIRPMYSNPPIYGARLVSTILADAQLTAQWREEVKIMADRIIKMRHELVDNLKKFGSTRDWSHVTNQIGMFCFTGMTPEQVDALRNEHVYLTRDGRISVAGITSANVQYLAESIVKVTGGN